MKWKMDIIGKLPVDNNQKVFVDSNQKVFVLVLADYFTKWIKAEAFSKVRDTEILNFIWKNIICRFDILREIVTDNRPQFIPKNFQQFFQKCGIKLNFSTPRPNFKQFFQN